MKTAFLYQDGFSQVVLTPEGDAERGIVKAIADGKWGVSIKWASFGETLGGYVRRFDGEVGNYSSLMLILRKDK